AYGTGLFGGPEVEQAEEAVRMLEELAELDGKQLFGKTTPEEDQRLQVLRQRFSTYDSTSPRHA
ncbi:MAG: hypothetical protein H7330_17355, partial [Hymenobacteraceae bacterium]|nr:hypothetical protein [Hymenobacteraceae bacterium]